MNYKEYWGGEIEFQVESLIQDYSNFPGKEKLEKIIKNEKLFKKLKDYVANKIFDDGWLWERINDSMNYYIEDFLEDKNDD